METSIKFMASALTREPILVMFSGGKDSIAMIDLAMKHFPKEQLIIISYYFVPDLDFKEGILEWYENKYQIKIIREPDHKVIAYHTGKKSYKQADQEVALRKRFNAKYIMQGIRKQDSMARRGMLANLPHGVDERNGKLYPVGEWSTRQIFSYIKINKLMLPVEYSFGFKRDIYIPNAIMMDFIKKNLPNDYIKIMAVFPELEMMARRVEFYGN